MPLSEKEINLFKGIPASRVKYVVYNFLKNKDSRKMAFTKKELMNDLKEYGFQGTMAALNKHLRELRTEGLLDWVRTFNGWYWFPTKKKPKIPREFL
ncbi:MAG: hypothetical protein Q7K34_00015 [archaeon]|nr:hypothetical protein [archaeon]